jgi:hypothetical protein
MKLVLLSLLAIGFGAAPAVATPLENLHLVSETGLSATDLKKLNSGDTILGLHAGDYPNSLHAADYPDSLHAGDYPNSLHAADYPDSLHAADYPNSLVPPAEDGVKSALPMPVLDL